MKKEGLIGVFFFGVTLFIYPLISIGLISFVAVAKFVPAIIGGIFWKRANWKGVLSGLFAGFAIWFYCLVLPSMARAGVLPQSFIGSGPFEIWLLRPFNLFGMEGLDPIPHALFWSWLLNVGLFIDVPMVTSNSSLGTIQASKFVDVFKVSPNKAGMKSF